MKLLVKFNLIFAVVVALGMGVSSWIARSLLQDGARQEVLNTGRLMMENALAVRAYTSGQIAGLLEAQLAERFLPQAVPSFSATEVQNVVQAKFPEFAYKEATLNPTNPRDRASGWEVDIVQQFRNTADLKEFVGVRDTPGGPSLYVARPLRITNPACLRCHSSVEAAPKSMIERYGPANGFGWQLNEVVGAQIVSVPMSLPLSRAERSFNTFLSAQLAIFVAVGLVLNLMIWWVVVRPVTRLSALADRVSQGDLQAPDFASRSRDEIGVLTASFARMRASVVQAMKMLED